MDYEDLHRYDSLLDKQPPEPQTRPRMELQKRAAQFMGFQALVGHMELLKEKARRTVELRELDEGERARLDFKLQLLLADLDKQPLVKLTYFRSDPFKAGGCYVTHEGVIWKLDSVRNRLLFADGTVVEAYCVSAIESELFEGLEL